jgi:hypothetical protein
MKRTALAVLAALIIIAGIIERRTRAVDRRPVLPLECDDCWKVPSRHCCLRYWDEPSHRVLP